MYQPGFAVYITLCLSIAIAAPLKLLAEFTKMPKTEEPTFESYFCNPEAMIIFALLYLEGDIRSKILGIHEPLYESKKKAQGWKRQLVSKLHPDRCKHPQANDALSKLNDIFNRMIQHGE
jgi:hypothetical protein